MGKMQRRKGYRVEREMVLLHQAAGVGAHRVPLSGAAGGEYRGDIIVQSHNGEELRLEVKSRRGGSGFRVLEGWLGDNDALLLKRDRAAPMVVLSWDAWLELLRGTIDYERWRSLVAASRDRNIARATDGRQG